MLHLDALTSAMKGSDFVFHLAANADVRFGLEDSRKDKIRLRPLTYFRRCKRVVSRELRSLRENLYAGNLKFFRRENAFFPFRSIVRGVQTRGRRADSSFLLWFWNERIHLSFRLNSRCTVFACPCVRFGDNPFIFLDCKKMRSYGWAPEKSIRDGILRTVRHRQENPWIFDAR
jgi:hypothetical protein